MLKATQDVSCCFFILFFCSKYFFIKYFHACSEQEQGNKQCPEVEEYIQKLKNEGIKTSVEQPFYDVEKLKEMAEKGSIILSSSNEQFKSDVSFPFTSFIDETKFIETFLEKYCENGKDPQKILNGLVKFTKELLYDPKTYRNQSEMGHRVSKIVPILDNFYRFKLDEYDLTCNRNVEVNDYVRIPDQKSYKSAARGKKPDFFLQQADTDATDFITPIWYLHEEKLNDKKLSGDFVKLCCLARGALDW